VSTWRGRWSGKRLAYARRGEHDERARAGERRTEVGGIAHREVIGPEAGALKRLHASTLDAGKFCVPGGETLRRRLQRGVDRRRQRPLRRRQVLIAGAHREPVGIAYRGRADDFHRHAQVRDHAADDGQLLKVLLAEHRDVRLHDVEQLRHHGADALEKPRAKFALQDARQSRHLDARGALGAVGIDLAHFGAEHEVAAGSGQHAGVLERRARIVREVLVRPELHRIHENAGDEALAVAACRIDETHVSGVQVAHGRDEGHPQALPAPGPHVLANRADRGYGVHGCCRGQRRAGCAARAKSNAPGPGIRAGARRARNAATHRDCSWPRP
jgi:hypothetical protein